MTRIISECIAMFFENQSIKLKNDDPHHIHEKILRNAQCSGTLSLPNRELKYVPSSVWNLNTPLPPVEPVINFETSGDDARWWETQPITKLILFSNKITQLNGNELSKLETLAHLDIKDNCLIELPEEIETLSELKQLIISCNKIVQLPSTLVHLKSLVWLDVSHNALTELPENFDELSALEKCDLSDNRLARLPVCFPPKLLSLNVNKNYLSDIPKGLLQSATTLKEFDASENKLQDVGIEEISPKPLALTVINLHKNRLTTMPQFCVFRNLKELTLGDNRIETLNLDCLAGLPGLVTINLARNKLTTIPAGLPAVLPNLVRLDVSNNDLTSVPSDLGFLETLQVLVLNGNPFRSISQNAFNSGTQALKTLLRDRHQFSEGNDVSPTNQSSFNEIPTGSRIRLEVETVNLPQVNSSGQLDWSCAQSRTRTGMKQPTEVLHDLPELDDAQLWWNTAMRAFATDSSVRGVKLAFRQLEMFPLGVMAFRETLTVLNLSNNRLSRLPDDIELLHKLTELNVASNCLASLNPKLTNLSALQTLKLDYNPSLGPILQANVICRPPLSRCLETISVRGCKLTSLPLACELSECNMPVLASIDVSENDITALEPELGLCKQIRSLQVGGNVFRIPRPAIVAKGTEAIMEYLRSRIVE